MQARYDMAVLREWLDGTSIYAGGDGEVVLADLPPRSIEHTLKALAAHLWEQGIRDYQASEAGGWSREYQVERLETAIRVLGVTMHALAHLESLMQRLAPEYRCSWVRAAATLAHMYLKQGRLDRAQDLANECLRKASDLPENDDGVATINVGDEAETIRDTIALARITLLKAHVQQGDARAARAQVDAMLASPRFDQSLLAAACEELSAAGPPFLSPATAVVPL